MKIEDLTIGQARELAALFNSVEQSVDTGPWHVGECYLIRTGTMILTGRLLSVGEHELLLQDAAWIADTGRFANALRDGTLDEIEPFPGNAIVGRGAIVDAAVWLHPLPRTQK